MRRILFGKAQDRGKAEVWQWSLKDTVCRPVEMRVLGGMELQTMNLAL